MNYHSKIIAVDFDGILFTNNAYPKIGKPIKENIKYIRQMIAKGNRIILFTCREGKPLREAVQACLKQGIIFTAINDQDPMAKILWKDKSSSKVYADFYLDDKAVNNIKTLNQLMDKSFTKNKITYSQYFKKGGEK